MNGLKTTGKMNRRTMRLMSKPRCGNPDIEPVRLPEHGRYRRQAYNKFKKTSLGDQWTPKVLKWKMSRFSNKLNRNQQQRSMEKVFKIWSEATPLKITYSANDADIDVSFARWNHGDGPYNSFDGRGMLLAHAYGPGDGQIAGDIHFDADEDWTLDYKTKRKHAKDFFATALHEAGHSLGLAHSTNKHAVMYPMYKGFEPDLSLNIDDVYKLQSKYGSEPYYKYVPYKKKPVLQTGISIEDKPAYCKTKIKAIFYGPNRRIYMLTSYQIYRVNFFRLDVGFPVRTRRLLNKAPMNPKAAVYLPEFQRLYIFKGYKVWRYTWFKLDKGYPIYADKHKEAPRAAINIPDKRGKGRVFLFGSRYFWTWNYVTDEPNRNAVRINKYWRGIPQNIDAAFKWKDGYIYIFKGLKYYKVSSRSRRVLPGYPKYYAPSWFGGQCGTQPK